MTLPHSTAGDSNNAALGAGAFPEESRSTTDDEEPRGSTSAPRRSGARRARRAIAILLLPVVTIGVFAGALLAGSISRAQSAAEVNKLTKLARQTTALTNALQAERGSAVHILAGNLTAADAEFNQRRAATERAAAKLRPVGDRPVRRAISKAREALGSLRLFRENVARGTAETGEAMVVYAKVISDVLGITDAAPGSATGGSAADRLREIGFFAHYIEAGEREAYVVYAAAVGGSFDQEQYREFVTTLAEQQIYIDQFNQGAPTANRRNVAGRLNPKRLGSYPQLHSTALTSGPSVNLGINSDEWSGAAGARSDIVDVVVRHLEQELWKSSSRDRTAHILYATGIAIVALLLMAGSIAIALRVARGMVKQLTRLRTNALAMAHQKLPAVIERLRGIDAISQVPTVATKTAATKPAIQPLPAGKNLDDIDCAAEAAEILGREAIEVAVSQAQLRVWTTALFVNLARRSQFLVDKVIQLIDKLKQTERDPDRLSGLFQLGHLITRIRRNDENLLVLAGAESGRQWTRSAPLADVLRASAAEIEQYTRVRLGEVVSVELEAYTVSDVVHLVAELLENATIFAPPRTQIYVEARISRGAILIEIRDQGTGLSAEQLAELNERLATPHIMDTTVAQKIGSQKTELQKTGAPHMLGLYVVAKLADRHGIGVVLQNMEPQGTMAQGTMAQGTVTVVSLPATLLYAGESSGSAVKMESQ